MVPALTRREPYNDLANIRSLMERVFGQHIGGQPPTVDAEQAQAKFENGLLRLTFPKKPEARSRSLKITPEGVRSGATPAPNGNQERQ